MKDLSLRLLGSTTLGLHLLRQVIARVVAADPAMYNEGFLGKENEEYCK